MSGVCVTVRVGAERYALDVDHVLEVAELQPPTPVPGAAESVLGMLNLHGQVVAVLSLAAALGLEPVERDGVRVVFAQDGSRRVGLAVDEVLDVGPLPEATERPDSPVLRGAGLVDGELVGIVDVPKLLDAAAGTEDA